MRWFNRGVKKEVWEEDIDWPLGDLEAANRIRAICSAASTSAEKMSARADVSEDKRNSRDTERYERAAKTAIRSAADMLEVGWPEPALVEDRMESTLSCAASSAFRG